MDFIDALRQFAARADRMKDQVQTEEATKTSLIMPFFQQVFGYDVFNPDEFVPEYTADVGIKKGEKVDYAIFMDGKPVILVEAKWCKEPLDKHDSQLFRYFGTTNAKFAILTNGIVYKFYTDLEEQNKMDLTPFLELDILNIKEALVPELKRFCKSNFNIDEIASSASELKYSNEIKAYLSAQLKEPSDDFVRHMITTIYSGMKTQAVIDRFKPIVKTALNTYISELMNERITTALKTDAAGPEQPPEQKDEIADGDTASKSKITTTEEELEAYYIVKAILSEKFDSGKITYRDTLSYFSVLYDKNNWVCRLKLTQWSKSISLRGENYAEIKHPIESVNDIFKFKDELIATAAGLEAGGKADPAE
jgi:hypothetical protein